MMADGIARRQADVCLGNALARIYSDDLTAPDEVAGLYGGIGYFADATRICRWLASAHGSKRQRRMALCVEPDQYREILLSREDREAAVSHVCEWIMGAEINISPQTVDGLLFAVTKSTPKHTTDRLSWLTSCVVCRPRTTTFWRNRLVADLMEAGMGGATPGSTLLACVLPIVTNGQFKPSMEMHAEKLIHVAEAMIQAEMAVS